MQIKGARGLSIRGLLLIMLSLVAVGAIGCAEDPTESAEREALAAEIAAGRALCPTVMSDETEPAVAQALEGATWEALGAATEQHVDGKRVSRAQFLVKGAHGHQARILPVSVECTSSCDGGWLCSGHGCNASEFGCSSYSCSGSECRGGCTKKSTYTPPPAN